MHFSTTAEAIDLIDRFEAGDLDRQEFTHLQFLTVGLYLCARYPFAEAIDRMRSGIRTLERRHGKLVTLTGEYHETSVVFWMIVIMQFLGSTAIVGFAEMANRLIEICGDPTLPLDYYSRARLFSDEARIDFLVPDLDQNYLFANPVTLAAHAGGSEAGRSS